MTLTLREAKNTTGRAKLGLLGFGGAGKTTTAALIAIGLAKLPGAKATVAMIDSENGSDFLIPLFAAQGIKFLTHKSRTFADLLEFIRVATSQADCIIIDSITHFWRDLAVGYRRSKNKDRLTVKDWAVLKEEWSRFSDWFVDAPVHAILCGRAGFEWDMVEDEDGDKELQKTGIKMKAEGEVGFEPSLLIEMRRVPKGKKGITSNPDTHGWDHQAIVLKDRNPDPKTSMDGQVIDNPTFESFQPHFRLLNLAGEHVGTAGQGDTAALFDDPDGRMRYEYRRQCEIAREEIEREFVLAGVSSQSASGKKQVYELLESCFHVKTWKEIEALPLEAMREGIALLRQALNPNAPKPPTPKVAPPKPPTEVEAPAPAPEPEPAVAETAEAVNQLDAARAAAVRLLDDPDTSERVKTTYRPTYQKLIEKGAGADEFRSLVALIEKARTSKRNKDADLALVR